MTAIDVRVLGPLEVRLDGETVAIPGRNHPKLLALLVDEAGKAIPVSRLAECLYDGDVPPTGEKQVQNNISELRRVLGPAADRLRRSGRAYRFDVDQTEFDLGRCRSRAAAAQRLAAEGSDAEAADELRDALAEWRGTAFAGMTGRVIEAASHRLEAYRVSLLEQRIDLDLKLGRLAGLMEELRRLCSDHPGNQRFTAQLMRALHRSGRTQEALRVFEAAKERAADALGADPDPELRELHLEILRDEPAAPEPRPLAAPDPAAPAMLPRARSGFTGRQRELDFLDDVLDDGGVAVVSGMGGIGKTALAVHWARRVASRFPDGQLHIDLRGFDPHAEGIDPGEALAVLLTALGVPGPGIPAGLDGQIALYRSVVADKRLLVVLDNARDAAQVRPLIPASPYAFTVVTSRDRLVSLVATEGARALPLATMSESDSTALLERFIGPENGPALERIAAACGGLPLALSLIGAQAASSSGLPLEAIADRLDYTASVLDALSSEDPEADLRSVFSYSFRALSENAATMFRLLGMHPGPDVTTAALASMCAVSRVEAERTVRELVAARLLDEHAPGRFAMHDLLRAYAVDRREAIGDAEAEKAAARRMFEHYVATADDANRLIAPERLLLDIAAPSPGVTPEPIADVAAAMTWMEAEYTVVCGLIRSHPEPELDVRLWELATRLTDYMLLRGIVAEGREIQRAALAAAYRRGDAVAQVVSLVYLAVVLLQTSDPQGAHSCIEQAVNLAEADGDLRARGFAAYGCGVIASLIEDHEGSREHMQRALELFAESGNKMWELRALSGVAWADLRAGRFAEGRVRIEQFVESSTLLEDSILHKALFLHGLAMADLGEGDFDAAIQRSEEAIELFESFGAEVTVANSRSFLGDAWLAKGDHGRAAAAWNEALRFYSTQGIVLEAEKIRMKLADLDQG